VEIAGAFNFSEPAAHAAWFTDGIAKVGRGMAGARGGTSGEQQTQWSSGRLAPYKPTPDGACKLNAARALEPDAFIGAAGSNRS
jgi:hypothetical protein